MKLTNELLVIDLECTASQDENGFQQNNDIIQVGAVLLDRDLKIMMKFESLVKPNEEISAFITQLTGITNQDVANAPAFLDVFDALAYRVGNHVNNIKTVRLAAWGTYFDIPMIRKSYMKHLKLMPYSGTAFDIKTLAFLWCSMTNNRTDKLSVEHVAHLMGMEFEGRAHNAFADANMEVNILKRIMNDFSNGMFMDGNYLAITKCGIK